MAADAAMMRGDRTAALAAARRMRHALEYTLITGVADALVTAAGNWDAGLGTRSKSKAWKAHLESKEEET